MANAAARGRTLILMGSARVGGDTAAAAQHLARHCPAPAEVIALAPLGLQPFRYEHSADDGFLSVVRSMGASQAIVFATPLYWYAMSGVLKTFFDRLTDLLDDPGKRPLGRALAGRNVWALVVGTDPAPPAGLAEPFRLTASYFDMRWRGLCYARSDRGGGLAMEELAHVSALASAIENGGSPGSLCSR
jgi:NAD(P)H-dependent FMN reductase